MNKIVNLLFILMINSVVFAQPIALHPGNPHYFVYRNKPLVLVTSAEHYGAVINADFDYKKYLEALHDQGMNYTRIFTGSYVEIPGSFGIEKNTLAPAAGKYIAPWERVDATGLFENEKKFDLRRWNDDYFKRLDDFVSVAEELDIIVEVTFFSSTYQDSYWERNPFNPANNINDIPQNLDRKKSNTLNNGSLTGFQKKLVSKIVTELNKYDNVIYEIQNEPWSDDPVKRMRILRTLNPNPDEGDWFKWAESASEASLAWQEEIAKTVAQAEKDLPKVHLVAQNYSNFKMSIPEVSENIDILNFHYAWPEAVWLNYGWNRPIVFDESGFAGSADSVYLQQAWQFMLAGGAGFNNLDYSFYQGAEEGRGANTAPGGGSFTLRKQLSFLRSFIESFDFINMAPDFTVVKHSPGVQWQGISNPGEQYALVFAGNQSSKVELDLPKGNYDYIFVSPFTGESIKSGNVNVNGKSVVELTLPSFRQMVALKISR